MNSLVRRFQNAIVRPEFLVLLILVVFEGYLINSSEGFHHIDEGAHFIDNVNVLKNPSISIGIWQRFGRVWLFALPAQLGHKAVMCFAALIFLATIFVSYKVAQAEQLEGKEWIVLLVGFQPIFLDISYTCFAELPAAFVLILSYYLYRTSQWRLALLVASLVFLFRFEMSVFAAVLALIAIRQRKYSALPYVLVGPLLWYLFAWYWTGDPTFLPRDFIKFGGYPKYIEGTSWDYYVRFSTDIFGFAQVGLLAVCLLYDLIEKRFRFPLMTFTVFYCVVINSLASNKELNWTGSVGDLRYLTPVSPFVGILALSGMSKFMGLLDRLALRKYVPYCIAAIIIVTTANIVKPHHLTMYEKGVMTLSREAVSDSLPTPILTNHWAATFAVLDDRRLMQRITSLSEDTLRALARAYILWDPQVANSPFSQQKLTFADVRNDSTVVLVDSIVVDRQTQFLFLKDSHRVARKRHR